MADVVAGFQFCDSGLDFSEVPFFGIDKGRDGLGGEKRLRTLGTFGECVEALFGLLVDSDGECRCHDCFLISSHCLRRAPSRWVGVSLPLPYGRGSVWVL